MKRGEPLQLNCSKKINRKLEKSAEILSSKKTKREDCRLTQKDG
jgi:hypothetical protein